MMALTGNTFFFPWEVSVMEWLQARLEGLGISVVSLFSMLGEELILILVLGLVYWGYNKRMGKTVGLSVLMGLVWNPMAKNIALRRRPYMDHESIRILRVVEPEADPMNIAAQGYSFPSGHSTNAFVLFAALARNLKKKWALAAAILAPLLVGLSRVAVGAHYPTDVLGGWVIALLAVFLVPWLEKKIRSQALLYALLLITALPGLFYCKSADYFSGLGLLLGFMLGTAVEEKYVRFENARSFPRALLRVLGGAALFFALNTLLKLPFSKDFLEDGSYASLFVRCARYAVISFLEFGAYPLTFRLGARIGNRRTPGTSSQTLPGE